jgi:hypothetical protein
VNIWLLAPCPTSCPSLSGLETSIGWRDDKNKCSNGRLRDRGVEADPEVHGEEPIKPWKGENRTSIEIEKMAQDWIEWHQFVFALFW